MLFLLNGSGQTGNRYRSLSSLMALGIETCQNVVCPVVPKGLLENLNLISDEMIDVKFYYNSILELTSKIVSKIFNKNKIRIPGSKTVIFTDWISFARPELLQKHYIKIKKYFDFTDSFKSDCRNKLPQKFHKEELLIAVHLRMGDYKEWSGGKYFYDIGTFIQQMNSLYTENNRVCFVIFSNEVIDRSLFEGLPYRVIFMNGSAQEDLCCMSQCDYIIGPPSTYSAWAGYIGNKKLIWMKDKNHVYKLEEFKNVPESMATTKDFWELQ